MYKYIFLNENHENKKVILFFDRFRNKGRWYLHEPYFAPGKHSQLMSMQPKNENGTKMVNGYTIAYLSNFLCKQNTIAQFS